MKLVSGAKQQSLIAGLVSDAVASGAAKSWGFDAASLALSGFHNELRDLFAVMIENQIDQAAFWNSRRVGPKRISELQLTCCRFTLTPCKKLIKWILPN